MKTVYLSCQETLPGSPMRREDGFEHDLMMDNLRTSFAKHNATITDIAWDDDTVSWQDFDAVIIGTAWDYWDRHVEFLAKLVDIETQTRLFNSTSIIKWNSHKKYLLDLERKGAKLIPTQWADLVTPELIEDAFANFETDELVLKRQVGAGGAGQVKISKGSNIPTLPHPMMVQPFLRTIKTEGELSFIFIDGKLSHTLLKTAATDDYRIQSLYGGTEQKITPSDADKIVATQILEYLDEVPLYARVDMLRDSSGELLLMEIELTEPYLYPEQGPKLGERLYQGLSRRL